jgi:hypothetical protein
MVRYQIPKALIAGFEILLSLRPEEVESLVHFLQMIDVGTGPKSFGNQFEIFFKKNETFTPALARTIFGLGHFKLNALVKADDEETTIALAQSFTSQSRDFQEGTPKTNEAINHLSKTLLAIFRAMKRLTLTFKAFSLMSENDSVYRTNHIITDIRLLFQDDIQDPSRHGLVIHQLKLTAEKDSEQYNYYFSLTLNDLQKLQEQIKRAMEKEEILRQDYKNSISFITITE